MLRLVLFFLMAYLAPVILAECASKEARVFLDGNTARDKVSSSVALPLGTTLVLTCHHSGITDSEKELMQKIKYSWKCPTVTESCQPVDGSFGRMINNNILAINITSEDDSGKYVCTVSAGDCEVSENFELKVAGGQVVHSYGRLILNEAVISDRRQLQPPNHFRGGGKIECRVYSGNASFTYYGLNDTVAGYKMVIPGEDHSESNNKEASVNIVPKALQHPNKFAIEGYCAGIYHYLFLRKDPNCCSLPREYLKISWTSTSITVTIKKLPDGIIRAIVGYTRLDLGIPVEGEYMNLRECETKTFSPLAYGEKYMITAWGLSGGDIDKRKRCWSPTKRNISLDEECKC